MKGIIGHIGLNLSNGETSFLFWKDLLVYLGFNITTDGNHFDASDGHSYLCISVTKPVFQQPGFHRKNTGLNHVAFKVSSAKAVDEFVAEFMTPRNIPALYGGAKAYPDYSEGYYAVYFEDPDRIKIEIVYDPT